VSDERDPNTSPVRGGGPPRSGGGGVLSASDETFKLAKRERRSGNLPEALIWRELRKRPRGFKFRRHHPLSELVLDFACLERRVAIEIDGFAHDTGDRPARDLRRDSYLHSRGFAVIRIPASEVLKDLTCAIEGIVAFCDEREPLHHQPAAGGPPPRAGEVFGKPL
jgi:very-short-patch-repair endonuclease